MAFCLKSFFKPIVTTCSKLPSVQYKKCHNVFRLKELLQQDKTNNFRIIQVRSSDHEMAVDVIKKHYLSEHILVRARNMDLNDRALDEYLVGLMRQGNALYAKNEDGTVAGVCVNFASSQVDPGNLRLFAYYRQGRKFFAQIDWFVQHYQGDIILQDPNMKDFLNFTAKLQETPNLWETFKEKKIFEIKMLTVLPEFRRQGLAVLLVEKSKEQALDQGYKVIRMDCINEYDYKVAERCMLQCIVRFPLHKLRGVNVPFIKRNSEYNRYVRVYVAACTQGEVPDITEIKQKQTDLESLIE